MPKSDAKIALSYEEKKSSAGMKMFNALKSRLESLRKQNDNINNGTEKTNEIRGRIAEVKDLISNLDTSDVRHSPPTSR